LEVLDVGDVSLSRCEALRQNEIIDSMETIWNSIGGFLDPSARAQARYNYEDLWEAERGSR
jgi:hypothetical protein